MIKQNKWLKEAINRDLTRLSYAQLRFVFEFAHTFAKQNAKQVDLSKWNGSGMDRIKPWVLGMLNDHIHECEEIEEVGWALEYRALHDRMNIETDLGTLIGLIQGYCIEFYNSIAECNGDFKTVAKEDYPLYVLILGLGKGEEK